jgi:hypothetical protein
MNPTTACRVAIDVVDREVCLQSELEHETVADGTMLAALRASWCQLLGRLAPRRAPGTSRPVHEQRKAAP